MYGTLPPRRSGPARQTRLAATGEAQPLVAHCDGTAAQQGRAAARQGRARRAFLAKIQEMPLEQLEDRVGVPRRPAGRHITKADFLPRQRALLEAAVRLKLKPLAATTRERAKLRACANARLAACGHPEALGACCSRACGARSPRSRRAKRSSYTSATTRRASRTTDRGGTSAAGGAGQTLRGQEERSLEEVLWGGLDGGVGADGGSYVPLTPAQLAAVALAHGAAGWLGEVLSELKSRAGRHGHGEEQGLHLAGYRRDRPG